MEDTDNVPSLIATNNGESIHSSAHSFDDSYFDSDMLDVCVLCKFHKKERPPITTKSAGKECQN
ncbi:hypothetical protein L484_023395 [Morus notabilis]|uniref:Uncharacterized protein n=1 Tax=Morus notabilis TaxID=981085 RepID=W9SU91_9ROSA|nr:hypothetical protein L484_023395 [Morus notabilis]